MELEKNKKIIIALFVIIIVLAAAIGFVLLNPMHAKEPTKIKITSDKSQYEGGNISVKLTNLNGTAISKEIVNITITDNKGKVVVDDVVKTNSKGKADLKLDLKKGKYAYFYDVPAKNRKTPSMFNSPYPYSRFGYSMLSFLVAPRIR